MVAIILAVISALALTLSVLFTPVADFLNGTVSVFFRILMSAFTSFLPFSVFEILLCILLPLLIFVIVFAVKKIKTKNQAVRFLFGIVCLPAFIFSGFVFALGIPYHTTTLDGKMGIAEVSPTAENLTATAIILRDEINRLQDELSLDGTTPSQTELSFAEISQSLTDAYGVFEDEYGFPFNFFTRAKPMIFDEVMSHAHLLGIYTFFTGESNINDGYPDYTWVNTVAHEFAHQRGIIREDEANFMAFAVSIRSTDPYIRYCGYLNMYEYVMNALYKVDKESFSDVHSSLSTAALADIRAYSEKSKQYTDSTLGAVVSQVNDAYLQMNGTPGTVSYSLCVRLAVAYYHN